MIVHILLYKKLSGSIAVIVWRNNVCPATPPIPVRKGQVSGGVIAEKAIELNIRPAIKAKTRSQMKFTPLFFKNRHAQALKIRLGRSAVMPNICNIKSAKYEPINPSTFFAGPLAELFNEGSEA